MKEVVCFILKGHEYGVDVSQMKSIVHKSELMPRDGLPDFIKGIVDVHGEQVPLVDADQLLSIPSGRESTLEKKNVVFTTKCGDFAMECDGISQIVTVEDSAVQAIPGFFDRKTGTNYADCIIKKKDNTLVLVMDPERLLDEGQTEKLVELLSEMKKERIEAERKRQEEERRRKEEEKRRREEEIARMNEGVETSEQPSDAEQTSAEADEAGTDAARQEEEEQPADKPDQEEE
ncbi:MAG: chemotaxis protein CheW [Eubacterium sp.]|nr:chemotaxis protein CheW [Eubacterium sp.]